MPRRWTPKKVVLGSGGHRSQRSSIQMLHGSLPVRDFRRQTSRPIDSAMSKQAAAIPLPPPPRIRILVVEESDLGRTAIAETLTAAGYDVVIAGTTARVLELVNDDEIGLVVSDIEMPDLFALE